MAEQQTTMDPHTTLVEGLGAEARSLRDRILHEMRTSRDWCMSTWLIARRLREATRKVRTELQRMSEDGLVRLLPERSSSNNCVWQIVEPTPGAPA